MNTPQIIMIFLIGAGLLISANQHGKPRSDENFWKHLLAVIISTSLLYWGGFFN